MSYKDSIIVERLRKKYGEYFCYIVNPWHMYGWERSVGTSEVPQVIFPEAHDSLESWLAAGRSLNEATTLKVVSSSANDVEAKEGASKIILTGIDENFDLSHEVVELNGTTAVDTANKWRDINSLEVIECGNPGTSTNSGSILVKDSTGTFVIASIYQSQGKSEMGKYTVPPGRELYITKFKVGFEGTSAIIGEWILFSSMYIENSRPERFSKTRILSGGLGSLGDTDGEYVFNEPLKFKELSQLSFAVQNVSAEAKVSVFAEGFEVITSDKEIRRIYKRVINNNYKYNYTEKKSSNRMGSLKNPVYRHVNAGAKTKQVT